MAEKNEISEGKIYAVLGYLSILCFIPLLTKKDNKFALFHAKQGLVLFIGELALWIIGLVPVLGWFIGYIGLFIFGIISLVGVIQALMGAYWKIPIVADYAEKIKL
ncbi:MAG: hypothetical protein PHS37_03895 [Candidatus Omnitrophica bacterium]|nr:hypothetical protein [Candidatus Omnitrophota bacterium]